MNDNPFESLNIWQLELAMKMGTDTIRDYIRLEFVRPNLYGPPCNQMTSPQIGREGGNKILDFG